jgi:hypothetical protein
MRDCRPIPGSAALDDGYRSDAALHLPDPHAPTSPLPRIPAPPSAANRSKAIDQLLLEMIPAIKVGVVKVVNNRKKRKRCENPD